MGGQFNKWWLLPFGILTTSALIASSIIIFGPTFADSSFDEVVARHGAHKPTETSGSIPECSDASANDHACYEQRWESSARFWRGSRLRPAQGRIHGGRVCEYQLPSPNPHHRSCRHRTLQRRNWCVQPGR